MQVSELASALGKANAAKGVSEREIEHCQHLLSEKDQQLRELAQSKTDLSAQLGQEIRSLEEKLV